MSNVQKMSWHMFCHMTNYKYNSLQVTELLYVLLSSHINWTSLTEIKQ